MCPDIPPPPPASDPAGELARLIEIVAILRGPGGCPWDREQTLPSLKGNFLEESAEVVDAIEDLVREEPGASSAVCEELGDLLMNILLSAHVAESEERFGLGDICREASEKLIRRHPHVFGSNTVADVPGVLGQWEEIKRAEKPEGDREASILDGVPRSLPAIEAAQKISRRAAKVGFDWPDARGALAKVREELEEVEACLPGGKDCLAESTPGKLEEEIGDLLFSVVNLSRKADIDAGEALRRASQKFRRRFRHLETAAGGLDPDLKPPVPLQELEALWQAAKDSE